MTEEMGGINSLVPRAYGYKYTVLHEDYVAIFIASAWQRFERSAKTKQDEKERDARLSHAVAKAYISYSLETLANGLYKTTGSEDNLWCYLSFPELERRLHGAYKMRTLKDAMKEMIEDNYVFKRPNTNPKYNTLEYRMNLGKYRSEIRSLPPKGTSANLHDLDDSTSANLHDEVSSAELHSVTGAKMHGPQCKNARTPSAKMHPIINSNRVSDKQEDTNTAHVSTDTHASLSRPLVFHPLHDFIALDDAIAPKEIVVFMTPEKYFSEYEDKRRGRIADEVHYELQQRGHHVTFKWEQEPESNYKFAPEVIDASSSNSSPSITESVPSETPSQPLTEATQPLTVESAPSEPALPKIEAEAQGEHVPPTAQSVGQSSEQENGVSHSQSNTPPSQQDSAKQAPSEQAKQPELIERPKKPVMPPESMKWCVEKMVLVTEAMRGKYFTEKQKKNERKAAEKIFAAEDRTELDYVEAFADRNDSWWRRENGLLNISDMAAVPKGKSDMRIVLIWEKLDLRKEMEAQKQGNLKDQKDNLQRKNIVDTGSRVLVPPSLTREQLKATEKEAV